MVEYDIESIQIQSLQNVIRLQDGVLQGSMKDSTNVAAVWRNECYRMSVQKRILEDECVRLGKLMVEQLAIQRDEILESVSKASLEHSRQSEKLISGRLFEIDSQVSQLTRRCRRWERCAETVRRLEQRNQFLEGEVSKLRSQLTSAETQHMPVDRGIQAGVVEASGVATRGHGGNPIEIHDLLMELRSLEVEAKQLLIKN